MGIKTYRPRTSSMRQKTGLTFEELTTNRPHKPLLQPLPKSGGRNSRGHISIRHRGGGHKRQYRIIDFKRDKLEIPGVVETIEYDPNRSAFILAPLNLKVGQALVSSDKQVDILPGNSMPLRSIPLGTIIHNIELKINKGGQLVRSAGTGAQVLAKEGDYAQIRMPSSEIRKVHLDCRATIGQIGNADYANISIGKANKRKKNKSKKSRVERKTASCARDSNESCRSSSWRRRREGQGRSKSCESHWNTHKGIQDEKKQENTILYRQKKE